MNSAAIYAVDKKVNKSLQDRLRRDRISKSVDQLKELILGPSTEHVKICKADILKLTVQYIRSLRQKELAENTTLENKKVKETCSELRAKTVTQNYSADQRSPCSTSSPLETAANKATSSVEESENVIAFCVKSVKYERQLLLPSRTSTTQFNLLRSPRSIHGDERRAPFRELDCNREQIKGKETIWRPWSIN
ncbi:enhancer of split mdelta protein-like [Montipora foliosa]|uniref:enhancer of split mdelta protein-like n=1 Tax=Montipora foliosa TaxID=591990 RepID=UPI0035F16599